MNYEIKEATIGQMMPIFDLLQDNPKRFQLEMVKVCVYQDGKPIGDAAEDLPLSQYMKLATEVMEINSFTADEKKS